MNTFKTHGVCSREIRFDIDGDIIKSVQFVGGCSGNTQGVSRLIQGMNIDEAIRRIDGIDCGGRGKIVTEKCPDCKGKGYIRRETKLTLNIPAGADTNSYIRKRGYGQA